MKQTQAEVSYLKQSPGAERCGICSMFIKEPESCSAVQDPIVPQGVCRIYEQMPDWVKDSKDYVVRWLAKNGIPVTRESYLDVAYPDGAPSPLPAELEAGLPPQLQEKGR